MAASFCFNFDISESNVDTLSKQQKLEHKEVIESARKKAKFITPSKKQLNENLDGYQSNIQCVELPKSGSENFLSLRHFSVKYVESLIKDSSEFLSSGTNEALKCNTDLIPLLYEGGMKIWECSWDLVKYLHKNFNQKQLAGKKVLELGCGAGLPGIYTLLHGATVHFQDYNEEVLKVFTIPNVALNLSSEKSCLSKMQTLLEAVQKTCQFSSGDWSSMISLLQPASYDIILTSETIYNIDMQCLLYDIIKHSVKPDGVVFVAAKSYYFGVGGSTEQFLDFVCKDGVFDISIVSTYSNGVKREIIKMQMISGLA